MRTGMILVDIDVRRIGYSSRRRVLTKCEVFVERVEGDWREEVGGKMRSEAA
jgi:hypothetical protein